MPSPSLPYTPRPQLGIHLTSVTISGLQVAASGALSVGTTVVVGTVPPSVANVVRHVNFTDSPGHQEINAMNNAQRNQVITDDGQTLDLQIYNVNNGNDPSPLVNLWLNYNYFYVVWVEGTVPGAIYTHYFYGVRGDLEKPFEGRGEQLATAHFLEMDPGAPTIPQYTRILTG